MALDLKPVHREREVAIARVGRGVVLKGNLAWPEDAEGAILFAHGSGSSRFSPRNRFVARVLQEAGLATLLLNLLSDEEAEDRRKVFDVELEADRLLAAADWLAGQPGAQGLRLGYFGASSGAAAALIAAARRPERCGAVVSRGGRPDQAWHALPSVDAPTLLIVGGDDHTVHDLNQEALAQLRCDKELVVIPEATHLFPEAGALDEVADLAANWFHRHLIATPAPASIH